MSKVVVAGIFLLSCCIYANYAHPGPVDTVINDYMNSTFDDNCTHIYAQSCLTLVLGEVFKFHISEANAEEIKMLMHYSFKNCPGLLSTFEIFGRFMEIKGMPFSQTLEWVKAGYNCGNGTFGGTTTHSGNPWTSTTYGPRFNSSTFLPGGKK